MSEVSREKMIGLALEAAKELGWVEFEVEDDGSDVMILLRAPGASEQVVEGKIYQLRRRIQQLVGLASEYVPVEEYDVSEESKEAEMHVPDPRPGHYGPDDIKPHVYSAAGYPTPQQIRASFTDPRETHVAIAVGNTGPDDVPHPEQLTDSAAEPTLTKTLEDGAVTIRFKFTFRANGKQYCRPIVGPHSLAREALRNDIEKHFGANALTVWATVKVVRA